MRERAAREGRNPHTGEALTIPASKVPAFKVGKVLKEAVKTE
ncbi:TPA: HU family DNA-binding protein [Bacillus toyonensis]|nr:HU family DNA-binding protein [Bacillus toyonensis]